MNVLLINVPIRERDIPRNFPTGLGIIAQVLRAAGHGVRVLDINALRLEKEDVLRSLGMLGRFDAVGVSGLISTYAYQQWLFRELRRAFPKASLIAGGGCVTSIPAHMLGHLSELDYGVVGEGELTIVELLDALERGKPVDGIAGLVYRGKDGAVVVSPRRALIADLDTIPFPAYDLFPTEIYVKNPIWFPNDDDIRRSMNMISSRGCPMDCQFCYHLFGRRSYRHRSAANVMKELEMLKNRYRLDFVAFVDDNMTVDKKFLLDFCGMVKTTGIRWGCHGRVDCTDDERIGAMAASNCCFLGFGIESGSQRILDAMHKGVTVKQAADAIATCMRHDIYPNTTYIFGYPGEDESSVAETVRFQLNFNICKDAFFATPYPGTPLYDIAKDKGLIGDEEEFFRKLGDAGEFLVNFTDMPDERFFLLAKKMEREIKTVHRIRNFDFEKDSEIDFLELCAKVIKSKTLTEEAKQVAFLVLNKYFTRKNLSGQASFFRTKLMKMSGTPRREAVCAEK